jgi:hypothetical protein
VAYLILLGRRRASEQEQSFGAKVVDATAHRIPQSVRELVLIYQTWPVALENKAWVSPSSRESGTVLVEPHLRRSERPGGGRLADRLRPGKQDAAVGTKPICNSRLNDSVAELWHCFFFKTYWWL